MAIPSTDGVQLDAASALEDLSTNADTVTFPKPALRVADGTGLFHALLLEPHEVPATTRRRETRS